MRLKAVSGIMLTLLLTTVLGVKLNVTADSTDLFLETDKAVYAHGEGVKITFTNGGDETVYFTAYPPFIISDSHGNYVAPGVQLLMVVPVAPGESLSWKWNQLDFYGHLAPAGNYTVTLEVYNSTWALIANLSTSFEIVGPTVVDVDPNALNLRSIGEWITAYIELPESYNISDIDLYSIRLNNTFPVSLLPNPPEPVPTEIGDHDNDGIPDLMVKFNRTALTAHIYHVLGITYGNVTLTITGEVDGTPFEGSDTIKVMFGGDADLNGFVELADFPIWVDNIGKSSGEWPSNLGPDFDSNGFVELNDFPIWVENIGAYVPPKPQ